MLPHDRTQYGVVMEIKQLKKDASEEQIRQQLREALGQITDNQYHKELLAHKVENRIEMAVLFVGKEVYIEVK